MATTLSPNMSLPIPTVGQEAGPDYASDVNSSLTILDQHTHAAGSGVPITPDAININTALAFNGNFASGVAGLSLTPQGSAPSNVTVYASGNDLYFVDGLGNNIRITQSGAVAGTPGSIANLVPPASASYSAGSSTFVWQSNTSIAANMDFGAAIMRNISPNSTFALTLRPPAALGSNYTLTLPTIPGSASFMALDSSGNMSATIAVSGGLSNSNFATGAQIPINISSQTTTYTVVPTVGMVLADATASAFTVTLYTAVGHTGLVVRVKKTDAFITNIVTIATTGGQTIDGLSGYSLNTQNEYVDLVSDGANWQIIEHYIDSSWKSAGTTTITGVTSNPTKGSGTTVDNMYYRRVGDSAEVRMEYRHTSAGTAGSGNYLYLIPTDLVIDTAKVQVYATSGSGHSTFTNTVGTGTASDNGSLNSSGSVVVYDTTHVRVYSPSSNEYIGASVNPMSATVWSTTLCFMVPISGWNG